MKMKEFISIVTLCYGMALSAWALCLPPQGVIDGSVLNLMAQLLIFAGACLGLDVYIRKLLSERTKEKGGKRDDE